MNIHFKIALWSVLYLLTICGNDIKAAIPEEYRICKDPKVIVAYVTSWSDVTPEPHCMTHINYAFEHINENYKDIRIDKEERLRQMVCLKNKNPKLKVLLSIGDWGSGGFSEMAANAQYRKSFAKDCKRIVKEFGLVGIDIDWKYPSSSKSQTSESQKDTPNFTLLMKDIRKALGKKKLLTVATIASAEYIDFKAVMPFVDFINIISYAMALAPKHHSPLFRSEISGNHTSKETVIAHLNAGVPTSQLVMGMPFYGRGGERYASTQEYKKMGGIDNKYTEKWDDIAKVPYLVNNEGTLVFGFENPRSLSIKCQHILDMKLLGGMYWQYAGDNEQGDLRRTVYETLMRRKTSLKP